MTQSEKDIIKLTRIFRRKPRKTKLEMLNQALRIIESKFGVNSVDAVETRALIRRMRGNHK